MTDATITLTTEQTVYLREILGTAAAEGKALEEGILEDGGEGWDHDWPDALVDAAYERSRIAQSILDTLPPQH